MKILYVLNDTFRKGGTESVIFNYFNHIDIKKFQIDFLLHTTYEELKTNDTYNELIHKGIKVFYVTPRRISIKKNRKELDAFFSTYEYDIIHSHADCIGSLILKIAKKNGIKIRIAHSHSSKIPIKIDGVKDILHFLYLEYCRFNIRYQATNYMACSDISAKWLFGKKNTLNGKVYILYNAIETEKYKYCEKIRKQERNKLGLDKEFLIGHVGRFSREKNHDFILQVFSEIVKRDNSARLLLVGEGINMKNIKERSRQMGIADYIIFYGRSENVSDLLQAMDIFIFPSLYEGLSVALVEAQASGLPCYVSDCKNVSKESCITDLVTLIPIDNKEAWVDAIVNRESQRDSDCSEILRKNGYDICCEAKKLESYYLNLKNKWT